jgi:hypothetical protein
MDECFGFNNLSISKVKITCNERVTGARIHLLLIYLSVSIFKRIALVDGKTSHALKVMLEHYVNRAIFMEKSGRAIQIYRNSNALNVAKLASLREG